MSFAKQLKLALAKKEMTQAELSDRIGKGRSSVSQYLAGKNIPKEDVQQQIAEVLDCTVEFLNGETPIEEASEDTRNVSVAECARRLGKSEQFVRIALQTGVFPFGFAVRMSSKYSYHISSKKLAEYIGG